MNYFLLTKMGFLSTIQGVIRDSKFYQRFCAKTLQADSYKCYDDMMNLLSALYYFTDDTDNGVAHDVILDFVHRIANLEEEIAAVPQHVINRYLQSFHTYPSLYIELETKELCFHALAVYKYVYDVTRDQKIQKAIKNIYLFAKEIQTPSIEPEHDHDHESRHAYKNRLIATYETKLKPYADEIESCFTKPPAIDTSLQALQQKLFARLVDGIGRYPGTYNILGNGSNIILIIYDSIHGLISKKSVDDSNISFFLSVIKGFPEWVQQTLPESDDNTW